MIAQGTQPHGQHLILFLLSCGPVSSLLRPLWTVLGSFESPSEENLDFSSE